MAGAHLLIHTSDDAPMGLRWRLQTLNVVLAPGIYRVTARCSKTRRSYTVALSPGSTFDLHLHLPLGRPAH